MGKSPKHNIPVEPKSIAAVGERAAIRIILASFAKIFAAAFHKLGVGEFGYSEVDCLRIMRESIAENIMNVEIEARSLGDGIDSAFAEAELRLCAQAYLNTVFDSLSGAEATNAHDA